MTTPEQPGPEATDPYQTHAGPQPAAGGANAPRFHVLRPHATGNLGEVFVAHDAELHREVALKQIQSGHAHDSESRRRFLVEAEITGRLEHPGIVPVYSLGTHADGRPYYAMRFIRGTSLLEAIDDLHAAVRGGALDGEERSLRLRRLLRSFIVVCQTIHYAHGRGVLHRDIKPHNIMLGRHGETIVVDWGLAKSLGDAPAANEGGRLKKDAPESRLRGASPQTG
ncbi:MAG: serine/threonine-protein kinase, partial [Planctomycetia bacterium]